MAESLGIHTYRPLPTIVPGSNKTVENIPNTYSYESWLDKDWDSLITAPTWVQETGEVFDSYQARSVAFYQSPLYYFDTYYDTFFQRFFDPFVIVPIPYSIDQTNGISELGIFLSQYREDNQSSLPITPAPTGWGFVGAQHFYRIHKAEFYRKTRVNYMALVNGFKDDIRVIPELPTITPSEDRKVRLSYYAKNQLEPIPDLTSIYWNVEDIELASNIPYQLPIKNCVLGTLVCSDSSVRALIEALPTQSGKYSYGDLFPENITSLMASWGGVSPNTSTNIVRKLAANNNAWNNADLSGNVDLNVDINHPMFAVDNNRSIAWHTTLQTNGSYGSLIMDSPRIIELHTALNASQYLLEEPAIVGSGTVANPQTPAKHKLDWYVKNSSKIEAVWKALGGDKYATNLINGTREKVTNLGFLIENIARVNGLRFNDDGDIDIAKEKDLYQPKTINNPTLGLPTTGGKYNSYGMSCFGTIGMIIPHLPTTYGTNGSATQLFDVVHDHAQLQMAILRQQDVSLSIQHGSEIRVRGLDGKVHAYPNQLAVNLECLQRLEKISYLSERNLLIGTVAGNEIRELFSGIGIPITQKFMPLRDPNISKKVLSIPYFGHQKNKPSTAQMLTTVHVNLAVINGVLMPKKQPVKNDVFNPFKKFAPPKQ